MQFLFVAAPLMLLCWAPSAQIPETPVSFEVASVKPASAPTSTKDDYSAGYNAGMRAAMAKAGMRITGQRVNIVDNSLRDLIRLAYQVKDYQISAPAWAAAEKYQIVANMPAGSDRSQAPAMLRSLLAARFHLELHNEMKQLPVYAIVAAKGGPKLTPPANPPTARGDFAVNPGRLRGMNLSLAAFADALSQAVERPVVDATGIAGVYDFKLDYTAELTAAPTDSAPTLEMALAAIGLKLEKREVPVEMLVVDRADKVPIEN